MRAYSQEGEGAVFGWGDDFDGEDGGEDADDAEAEDVEFEDFAASLTPEETCERISKLAAAHIANVLGFELPPDLGERAFDPAAIARSPQPLPAALEFTLAAGADSAVLASCPTDRADARGHLSAPRDRAAFGEDPEAPSTSLAAFRVPSAPERSARIRLHDPRRPSAYPRLWSLLRTVHAHCSEGRTVTNRGLYYLLATADHALWARTPPSRARRRVRAPAPVFAARDGDHHRRPRARGRPARGARVRNEHGRRVAGLQRDTRAAVRDTGRYRRRGGDPRERRRSRRGVVRPGVEKDAVSTACGVSASGARAARARHRQGVPRPRDARVPEGIQNRFPSVTTLGLVDWNPSGALILRAYRSGSARAAPSRRGTRSRSSGWACASQTLRPTFETAARRCP